MGLFSSVSSYGSNPIRAVNFLYGFSAISITDYTDGRAFSIGVRDIASERFAIVPSCQIKLFYNLLFMLK